MPVAVACRTCARRSPRAQRPRPDLGERWPSRLVATAEEDRVSTTIERWCGGRALPWHRVDVGFFGAHALSRYTRVARMDSCDPLLATHFLLERQVEARRFVRSPRRRGRAVAFRVDIWDTHRRELVVSKSRSYHFLICGGLNAGVFQRFSGRVWRAVCLLLQRPAVPARYRVGPMKPP